MKKDRVKVQFEAPIGVTVTFHVEEPKKEEEASNEPDMKDIFEILALLGSGPKPNSWKVVLEDFGPQKIAMIKYVKELKNLGLRAAKLLVGSVPSTLVIHVDWNEALTIKEELEAMDARVNMNRI